MDIREYITKDSILIIPNHLKEKVIKIISDSTELISIKYMSLEEFRNEYFFRYKEDTVLYLMDKYEYGISFSKTILELLYYVDKKCDDEKINHLIDIKNDLIEKGYIITNFMFKDFISKKDIFIYGYTNIDKFSNIMLQNVNCKRIDINNSNIKRDIYLFSTLEEEVEFVFNNISSLLQSGITIDKVKLVNISDDYLYTLKRYSRLFDIPINEKDSIFSTRIVKAFIDNLKETKSFEQTIMYIEKSFNLEDPIINSIYSKLITISNKYNSLDYSFNNIIQLVISELKDLHIEKVSNGVEILPLENNHFYNDEYVFLMGFNQTSIPSLYKDEDYISDIEKEKYNLLIDTTSEKNNKSINSVVESINRINNLTITSKKKTISGEEMISNLKDDLGYNVIDTENDYSISYSEMCSKIRLCKDLDDFIKFGINRTSLDALYSNFEINYLSYKNDFTGIDNIKLLKKISPLVLSYSSVDNYYHCGFKYYISNILKLDKFEENFSTKIGNLFHYILSICFKEDFNFEEEYDKYINKLELDEMEEFFIRKLKSELSIVIDNVKDFHKETGLDKMLLEHKIEIDKSCVIPVSFKGFIDKIMYKEKEKTLVSIIDYKTGKQDINLYNLPYGLSMQLPIYLYLVKNSNLFTSIKFTGFYLQKILSNEVSYTLNKSYLEQKNNNLKLEGFSTDNICNLEVFLPDYEDSKFVKGMKTTSKGFAHYTNVLSDEQMEKMISIVDKKIIDARDSIIKGDFSINPKQIGIEKIGCEFCKYRDLCFRKNEDFVKLKEISSLDFLGGDSNA